MSEHDRMVDRRDRLAEAFGIKKGSDAWKRLTTMRLQAQIDWLCQMLA